MAYEERNVVVPRVFMAYGTAPEIVGFSGRCCWGLAIHDEGGNEAAYAAAASLTLRPCWTLVTLECDAK
jgi:hypothetical protein